MTDTGFQAAPTHVTIELGDLRIEARLELEKSPIGCAAPRGRLPIEGDVLHARWSGEALRAPPGLEPVPSDLDGLERYPAPGQILLYPGATSEPEILIPYGPTAFACRAGPIAGSHVLTVENHGSSLSGIGRLVLMTGARRIRVSASAA